MSYLDAKLYSKSASFSQVHLCEAVNVDGYISDEYFMNRASAHTPKVLVAVKMLRRNADDRARYSHSRPV